MLRRYTGLFLAAALVLVALLIAALAHDFGQPGTGWLTTRPTVAGILIAIAYLFMILFQFGNRGGPEE